MTPRAHRQWVAKREAERLAKVAADRLVRMTLGRRSAYRAELARAYLRSTA